MEYVPHIYPHIYNNLSVSSPYPHLYPSTLFLYSLYSAISPITFLIYYFPISIFISIIPYIDSYFSTFEAITPIILFVLFQYVTYSCNLMFILELILNYACVFIAGMGKTGEVRVGWWGEGGIKGWDRCVTSFLNFELYVLGFCLFLIWGPLLSSIINFGLFFCLFMFFHHLGSLHFHPNLSLSWHP